MSYTTLISTEELVAHLDDPHWAVFDCRCSLAEPEKGRQAYRQAHIPGALFADLNEHLSSAATPGVTGRHPLPEIGRLIDTFSAWGISPGVQVVAYDDLGGALSAARLWWLLNWLGHTDVAVLDGGWQAWQAAGLPVRSGDERRKAARFQAQEQPEMIAEVDEVDRMRLDPASVVIDSRTYDRYLGKNEKIDPVAGHIPGAVSGAYVANLTKEGTFQPVERLRMRFEGLLGDRPASQAVFYCGSGVTAAQNVLAMKHAGLGLARLYPGSWSEWITDPSRPIATGE